METQLQRRLFNVDEFHRMGETGVLSDNDRVELIEGEIVTMTPIGIRHAACVLRLTTVLSRLPGAPLVAVQNPVRLDRHSELQPDIALLKPRADFYAHAHPGPTDVLLIIEVADTTARYDREIKLPVYARAGIPELWIVDLVNDYIEVNTRPSAQGYLDRQQLQRGASVRSAASGIELSTDEILG